MGLKILIDDARSIWDNMLPRHDYDIQFTGGKAFIDFLMNCGNKIEIDFVSFDHDLGIGPTGYDCANALVAWVNYYSRKYPSYHIHSMNPVGKKRIKDLLDHAFSTDY